MKLHMAKTMAKRKRSSAKLGADGIVEIDDDSSDSEVYKKQNSNSFSGRQQSAACNPALTEITPMQAAEEMGKSESSSVLVPFPHHEQSQRDLSYESAVGKQEQRLNSHVFECYLENLWKGFSKDKKTTFTYLDCLWFSLYRNQSTKTKVLMWIKRKNIFSRKYVFVPIVRWKHWSLLILCHLGENLESKARTPCMLLLDSLELTNPKRLEPEIRKFLLDIYRAEERLEREDLILKMPFLVPKVPQQRNGEDCGIFVLYFINLFSKEAPENFSISEGYPYFMKDNWFSSEHFENFCKDVRSSCWLSRTKRMNKDRREMEELPHVGEQNQVKKDRISGGEDICQVKQICTPLAERTRRPTTTCKREKAKHSAQMLKTEKPSFMVVMKPSYLRKGLNVPLAFARAHFAERAHSATLQLPNGRTWSVQFYFCKIKAHLSGGWNKFVQENMLENGDCCVFELLKVGEIEFKVSIFHVVEKVVQPGSSVMARRDKPCKINENKVTCEARDFKSRNPFFEVYMRPAYARYMNMSSNFVKRHLTNKLQCVVLQDAEGKKWPVRCFITKCGACRLGDGWGKFVKKNNIEEGDVCVFELIEKKETVLKVSIFRSH